MERFLRVPVNTPTYNSRVAIAYVLSCTNVARICLRVSKYTAVIWLLQKEAQSIEPKAIGTKCTLEDEAHEELEYAEAATLFPKFVYDLILGHNMNIFFGCSGKLLFVRILVHLRLFFSIIIYYPQ